MQFLVFVLLPALVASCFASDYSDRLSAFYRSVGQHVARVRSSPSYPNSPQCNLSSVTQVTAPTPLPSPSDGLVLTLVAIGRGTQNYTCDVSNATATPVSAGALAVLFNASCIAALYPDILEQLPALALDAPTPISLTQNTTSSENSQLSPANLDVTGHHYFVDNTTPTFNLNDSNISEDHLGQVFAKKVNSSSAPDGSVLGQNGEGYGSVAWLFLEKKEEETSYTSTGKVQQVYRLNTAGGSPPQNCTGMSAEFTIEYAAEYWFYESS